MCRNNSRMRIPSYPTHQGIALNHAPPASTGHQFAESDEDAVGVVLSMQLVIIDVLLFLMLVVVRWIGWHGWLFMFDVVCLQQNAMRLSRFAAYSVGHPRLLLVRSILNHIRRFKGIFWTQWRSYISMMFYPSSDGSCLPGSCGKVHIVLILRTAVKVTQMIGEGLLAIVDNILKAQELIWWTCQINSD